MSGDNNEKQPETCDCNYETEHRLGRNLYHKTALRIFAMEEQHDEALEINVIFIALWRHLSEHLYTQFGWTADELKKMVEADASPIPVATEQAKKPKRSIN